ncbi:amino acid-binding protein [Arthrobacter sp. M4]|uniref:amino acid-binding protein n=1 Tax=Arthrobacter sp. M4 TaxID=218160 RepID=UPI001CDD8E31|nr:amino acid-binding protein [Arthrobacter sp. M4]MCA4133475.1 amino acid-binding protein [Arthrobacter sp. M4]
MKPKVRTHATAELSCEVCGQLPEPPKARLTLANIAIMLPIELLVHALVVETHLPYVAKVLLLTVTATVLVIWVAEPSAAKVLRGWLHAPALRHRRKLSDAPALWRARTVLRDQPGALKKVTASLARLDTNILSIHVHPMDGTVVDEFVLSAPGHLREHDIVAALDLAGGRETHVWPTTALAMADGQTKALSLAARVAANPDELPLAVAELLGANIVAQDTEGSTHHPGLPSDSQPRTAGAFSTPPPPAAVDPSALLKIPTAWHGPLVFSRPGEPFTPAESARAHRLAELAEILAHSQDPTPDRT